MFLAMEKFAAPDATAAAVAATVVPDPAPIPTAATPATAALLVESSVPGADIEVDGAFAGSTPSTLSMAHGQHTIVVKKKGYEDWTRTMNVSGTGVKLSAELEAKP